MAKALTTAVIAIAAAMVFTFTAWSGSKETTPDGKPVQAQMSGCNKCNMRGTAKAVEMKKDCNWPGCDKTIDGKPCPEDCPKKK